MHFSLLIHFQTVSQTKLVRCVHTNASRSLKSILLPMTIAPVNVQHACAIRVIIPIGSYFILFFVASLSCAIRRTYATSCCNNKNNNLILLLVTLRVFILFLHCICTHRTQEKKMHNADENTDKLAVLLIDSKCPKVQLHISDLLFIHFISFRFVFHFFLFSLFSFPQSIC